MRGLLRAGRLPVRSWVFLAVAVSFLLSASPARADALADVRARGTLLWGADQEGGGPFVFPREDDPANVQGFEVDLAAKIAGYLKVQPAFTQAQWDSLTEMLRSAKVDVVLNGYEWTPTRASQMESSIPYYVYALQLLVRTDDPSLASWDDLDQPGPRGQKRKVSALIGSAAETYLRKRFGERIEVITYEGNTDAMREVETGKVDATLQDTPIASFYASRFPKLRKVGEPVEPGYYVALVQKGERGFVRAINEALVLLIKSGELKRIYDKYGIWDERQAELAHIAEMGRFYGLDEAFAANVTEGELPSEESVQLGQKKSGLAVFLDYGPIMAGAAGITVLLALISFPLAILIGLLVAVGRLYGPRWLARPLGAYVEFLRGTPLMLQLYFIFFFLPEVGIRIPAFATGIIGLAVNYSAYEAEIYRAGLQAIPRGQMEAALSLGMSRTMALRRIIVPQAVRMVIPPVMNDFIALFKDTSVCSVVTIVELTKRYSVLSMSTQATVELMVLTAILYLGMSYPMSLLSRRLERSLGQEAVATA